MSDPRFDPRRQADAWVPVGASRLHMEPLDAAVTAPLPMDWLAAMAEAEEAQAAKRNNASISTVARRGTLNLIGAGVSGVLNFVLVVIVTRTLHSAGAGLFFEATSVFLLAGAVAKFGSDTALVRFISQDRAKGLIGHIRRHIAAGIAPSAFFALIAGALLFWFAPQLAAVFELTPALKHNPELVRMIRVLAVFIPVYVTYWNGLAVTVGFGSMLPSVVVDSFMTSALQPVIVFVAAEMALGSGVVAAGYAAPMALGLIPIYLWVRRLGRKAGVGHGPASNRQKTPGTPAKDFWLFAIPRGVASIFQVGQDRIGILLVGALDSAAGAGVFAAAARWLIAGSVFSDALNLAIMPTMSEHLARRDYATAGRLYQVTTGWVVLISGPMYLTMSIFPGILLRPFGHGFPSGSLALTVLAIGAFAGAAMGSNSIILLMGGKSSWNLFDTSLAVGTDLIIGIVLIPHFGLLGAALATDAALLINNVIPVMQIYRFYRMHPFGQGFWVGMAASLTCFGLTGVAVRLFIGQSFPAVLGYVLLSCAAYTVMLWLNRNALQLTSLTGLVSGRLGRPNNYAPRHGRKAAKAARAANAANGQRPARPGNGQRSAKLANGQRSAKLANGQRSAKLPNGQRSAKLPNGQRSAKLPNGRKSSKDLRM
jgi:O-antigen/teichoic acid export membrane protein